MALPLILAGPILRRVDATLAAVWVALSRPSEVCLKVWEGQFTAREAEEPSTAGSPFVQSDSTPTLRLGEALHLLCVSARIPPESGKSFRPDTTYCYNLEIKADSADHTLKSEGMLEAKSDDDGRVIHVPLGYEPDLLPSFAPPPSELTDLRIVYGSCRRPAHQDPDAMVWIDDHILAAVPGGPDLPRYKDPRARPHQLFLGGDQIYADDVYVAHMLMLIELGQQLLGSREKGPDDRVPPPLEDVDVGPLLALPAGQSVDPEHPLSAYREAPDAGTRLPADRAHFPEELRRDLTQRAAQFTSTDGVNHLISIGEFAAMYLSVWSNSLWTEQVPLVERVPDPSHDDVTTPLAWHADLDPGEHITYPKPGFPDLIPVHLYHDVPIERAKPDNRTPEERRLAEEKEVNRRQRGRREALRIHGRFLAGLPRVRRVLANVPTYMILDDHDVTDDYFLNPIWRKRVLDTNLGRTILRNAMLTYALFQDWGNDPRKYDSGARAELLTRATELFPPIGPAVPATESRPITSAADRLDELFGHDIREHPRNAAGRFESVAPPISWHFKVDGPKHRVVALDNRTRRSYVGELGPPGNVSPEALRDQIPPPPLPPGVELLVVVAPLQVIGPPIIDELLAPSLYRLYDLSGIKKGTDIDPASPTGKRGMTGTNPDAIEAWALDAETFEHLLGRLAEFGKVVVLSGDVHNSTGNEMSYWRTGDTESRRIIQFTSSGFKNVMPAIIYAVDRSAGFAQQLIRANLGTERIGWFRTRDDLVLLPEGKGPLDVSRATRKRLRREPVMIPTWGWPMTPNPSRVNPDRPPDWQWRTKPLVDRRPDDQRPEPIRPTVLDDAAIVSLLADPETVVEAHQKIAARHQSSLGKLRNARQIMFRSNFGLVRFELPPGEPLTAVHEVYTAFTDPGDANPVAEPNPEPYLQQRASLEPIPGERLPAEELRLKPIEVAPREDT